MGSNIHKQHTIYRRLVHALGVHGGAKHSAPRVKNMKNGRKWPKMRTLMAGASVALVRLRPG